VASDAAKIVPFEDAPAGAIPVRGYIHVPPNPPRDGIVLTHGAGSDGNAPLLVAVAGALCNCGWMVLRCDLPFRQLRPHGPPLHDQQRDREGLRRAVEMLRAQPGVSGRIFLGGHSYGGRQGTILAAADPNLAGALLLLSYPLHPPKSPRQLRTAHFPQLRTPALFVHGTRDGFGTIDEMQAALKLIPARTELLPVESAGHELLTARNRDTLPGEIASAFTHFVASLARD
jgi:predicted alpha/beta-hydrolase family hydrolase